MPAPRGGASGGSAQGASSAKRDPRFVDKFVGAASPVKLGMWIFLLSDGFSFAALLASYGALRLRADVWWPQNEPEFGINFTAALTFLLICSSVTMVSAVTAAHNGNRKKTLLYLGATILGGAGFLLGQYHEYFGLFGPGLIEHGLVFGTSHRATTFYLITGFHGLHVAAGVIYLCTVALRTARGRHPNADSVEAAGLFWHFVDLVWILVFTLVYLIAAQPGG